MMIRHHPVPALAATVATLALVLTACSDDADDPVAAPISTAESAPTDDETTADPLPEADYSIIGANHRYGPGRWALTAGGDPGAPMAVFDVPDSFQGHESFVWADYGQGAGRVFGQLTYWTVTAVPADPCNGEEPSVRVGPSVRDLAAALVAQRRTTTTKPIPVELDGYRGLYLELQTPTDLDYASCGTEDAMQIWQTGNSRHGRYLEEPATDRYWILDVGQRPVILTAMTLRPTNREAVELITGVAENTTFVDPE